MVTQIMAQKTKTRIAKEIDKIFAPMEQKIQQLKMVSNQPKQKGGKK